MNDLTMLNLIGQTADSIFETMGDSVSTTDPANFKVMMMPSFLADILQQSCDTAQKKLKIIHERMTKTSCEDIPELSVIQAKATEEIQGIFYKCLGEGFQRRLISLYQEMRQPEDLINLVEQLKTLTERLAESKDFEKADE